MVTPDSYRELKSPNRTNTVRVELEVDALEAIAEVLGPGVAVDGLRGTPIDAATKTANHGFLQVQ